jgi:hypothetical protein
LGPKLADLSKIENTVGIWSLGDFRPEMPTVSGRTALIHRLCVRLQTPRGRFTWWPAFGTDIAQFLNSKARPGSIAAAAEAECLKDEQVEDVQASASYEQGGRAIRLSLTIIDAAGPFERTLLIEQARLTLIELDEAA